MMKRSDDVFLFTLIDFLVQVFFFGLLLYVVGKAMGAEKEVEQQKLNQQIAQLKQATGFSNLTELTDLLTKLAPTKDLRGTADFIARAGGADKAKAVIGAVEVAGGADAVNAKLEKLRKLEEGSGRPPCLYEVVNGKKVVRPLALVIANDTHISFREPNVELEKVLARLGTSFASVQNLTLDEFKRTFTPLVQRVPECRYTLAFQEKTRFVDARDAARFAFYLSILTDQK